MTDEKDSSPQDFFQEACGNTCLGSEYAGREVILDPSLAQVRRDAHFPSGLSFQGVDGKPLAVTGIGSLDDEPCRTVDWGNTSKYPSLGLSDEKKYAIYRDLRKSLTKRREALARLDKRGLKVSSKYIN